MGVDRAVADTSVLIGVERGRIESADVPDSLAVSIVTVGELKVGVLAAEDPHDRAARLRTLTAALALEPLPIDEAVADVWAEMRIAMRSEKRQLKANDSWIAATAIAHGIPLVARDGDYDEIPGLDVVKL